MTLGETARDRLDDVRDLEPTSNGELRDRWGMDSGSDVHRYLEEHLSEHVTRGDDGKIRVDGEPPQMDSEPMQGAVGDRSGTSKPEDDPNPSGESEGPETSAKTSRDGGSVTTTETGREQQMIDAAAEAGYESGFEEGLEAARSSTDPGEPACPECGETDWFDPREHGVDADRGCPECSTAEEWTVYDREEAEELDDDGPDETTDEPARSSAGTSPCPNCGTVVEERKIRAINSRRFREARCPGCGLALRVA